MSIPRVTVTEKASEIIDQLRQTHGDLMFHQSGGCCDGSAPMCYTKDEFMVGSEDIWLGQIHHCDFFISKDQFEYWKHTQLIIDVSKGRGASFSLEIPLGVRFMTKSRLFKDEELPQLQEVRAGEEVI